MGRIAIITSVNVARLSMDAFNGTFCCLLALLWLALCDALCGALMLNRSPKSKYVRLQIDVPDISEVAN